jgi:hypothetical protein
LDIKISLKCRPGQECNVNSLIYYKLFIHVQDKPEEPEIPVGAESPTAESEINYESSADTEPVSI